jgi:hypothetical protein
LLKDLESRRRPYQLAHPGPRLDEHRRA